MEKCGKFWKIGRFSGRIWPDWGNTTRADMAGLGSKGLIKDDTRPAIYFNCFMLRKEQLGLKPVYIANSVTSKFILNNVLHILATNKHTMYTIVVTSS